MFPQISLFCECSGFVVILNVYHSLESENGYQSYEPVPVGQMDTIPDGQENPDVSETKINDYGYSSYTP